MLNEQESTKRTKIRDAMYGQFMADRDSGSEIKEEGRRDRESQQLKRQQKAQAISSQYWGRRNASDGSRKSSKINCQIAEEVFKGEDAYRQPDATTKGTNSTNNKPTSEDLIEHDDDDLSEELSEDLSEDDEGFDAYD